MEQRIPLKVRMERLATFLEGDDWIACEDVMPKINQLCIVAAGPGSVAQIIPLMWNGTDFVWHEQSDSFEVDPFPTEQATHWQPWPSDPVAT